MITICNIINMRRKLVNMHIFGIYMQKYGVYMGNRIVLLINFINFAVRNNNN